MSIGHSLATAQGVILAVDQSLADFLRRPIRDMIDLSYLDITHPDDRHRNVRILDTLRAGDPAITIRKRYVRGDGSFVAASMQVSRITSGDGGGNLVGTLQLDTPPPDDPAGLWKTAKWMVAMQRHRRDELGDDVAADPLWEILLHIYLAEAEGRVVTCLELGARLNIDSRMVVRWIRVLEQRGLVEQTPNHINACQLTTSGCGAVERLLLRNVLSC